jgi:hypothetical protein
MEALQMGEIYVQEAMILMVDLDNKNDALHVRFLMKKKARTQA